MKKPKPTHFPSQLEQKTRELYLKLPRNISDADIANATGLSATWICYFVKGKSKFPSPGRLEKLYEYLSGKPLQL